MTFAAFTDMWSKTVQQKPLHADDAALLKQRLDRNRPTYSNTTDVALPDEKLCGHDVRYPKLGCVKKSSLKRIGPHTGGTQDRHKSMDWCSMEAVAEILNDVPDGSMHVLSASCASCIGHICEVGSLRSGSPPHPHRTLHTPLSSPLSPLTLTITRTLLPCSCSHAHAAHPHPGP